MGELEYCQNNDTKHGRGWGGRQHNGLYTHPSAVATNGDDDDDDEQVDLPCFVKTIPWQQ